MDDESEISQVDEVAALLSEAAEVHALAFRITDDEDPDWASWFAKWLLELSELPDLLGDDIPPSALIYELVRLDREYMEVEPDEPWEIYYAERLIDELGGIDLEEDAEDIDDQDVEDERDTDDDDEIVDAEFETDEPRI